MVSDRAFVTSFVCSLVCCAYGRFSKSRHTSRIFIKIWQGRSPAANVTSNFERSKDQRSRSFGRLAEVTLTS